MDAERYRRDDGNYELALIEHLNARAIAKNAEGATSGTIWLDVGADGEPIIWRKVNVGQPGGASQAAPGWLGCGRTRSDDCRAGAHAAHLPCRLGSALGILESAGKRMIYLTMDWPVSMNAYYMGRGHAKQVTKGGRDWRRRFILQARDQLGGTPEPMVGPVRCWLYLYPPDDRRKRDIDNFAGKHVLDALTKVGLWTDDDQIWDYRVVRRSKLGVGQLIVEAAEL